MRRSYTGIRNGEVVLVEFTVRDISQDENGFWQGNLVFKRWNGQDISLKLHGFTWREFASSALKILKINKTDYEEKCKLKLREVVADREPLSKPML